MRKIFSRWIAAITIWLTYGGLAHAGIQLPVNAAPCVRWAAGDVSEALRSAHIPPADAKIRLAIRNGGAALPKSISIEEQSFSLAIDRDTVSVHAGGAVGAMYGLEELAEQIRNQAAGAKSWKELTARLMPTTGRPSLEIRADNMFIHTSGTLKPAPPDGYPLLVNDLAMWRAYIDMLARDRYNLLDLHGAYDLESTSFPNLYPMLVHVPEYPQVGEQTAQRRNLQSLQAIIAYAQSRGIRVALMNYSANNGRSGEFKNEPSVTGVAPEKLADYTAKAVKILINELPGLYMLGFRVGESTQPASFYQDAYLKGIADANRPDLRIYTRSWQTTKEQLIPIAKAALNGFDIEIKFNGEHLGLPYQSMQGETYGSYSYQDYLDLPAEYKILWQIRANGTHRFWAWENTAFIRRTVQSCQLGNARGLTLEPPIAYFSVYPEQYYRSATDTAAYQYIWQKHWMWYYAWGRLGYDPDLPEARIEHEFKRHFGTAGETIYRAMQRSSEIVPLVYAYRFVGPDQRDFSPETETGNFDTKKKRTRQDLLQFPENTPEDERSYVGIDAYIEEKLESKPDGRVGPFTVARQLAEAADEAQALIASVPDLSEASAASEWRLLRTDLLAATYLGQYYAARICGMAHLEYALRAGRLADYRIAVDDLAKSREAWSQLSRTTDSVYRPLSNPLRHQIDFQWSSQNEPLAKLDATASEFWQKRGAQETSVSPLEEDAREDRPSLFDPVSLSEHVANDRVYVDCAAGEAERAILWWKPLPSELAWESTPMMRAEDGKASPWSVNVPFDARGLMYMVELQNSSGAVRNFPDALRKTPWHIISPVAQGN